MSTVPPHNLEAEASLLGACLASPAVIGQVSEIVAANDFYRDSHRHIFSTIISLWAEGRDVDTVTLGAELNRRGLLADVGGKNYLHTLFETVPVIGNGKQYAEIVREASIQRSLVEVGHRIAELGYEGGTLESAEELLYDIQRREQGDGGTEIAQLCLEYAQRIEQAAQGVRTLGRSTGFGSIDDIIGGFRPGELIILGARPGQGKSALAVNIVQRIGQEDYAALFSMEMSKAEIMHRLVCGEANVPSLLVRAATLNAKQHLALIEANERIKKLKIIIDDHNVNMASLRSKVRQQTMRHKLALVVLDYLQLMSYSEERNDSRHQEISLITRSLKHMAREFEVPVLCLSQLTRPGRDFSVAPRPRLNDLKESGSIEQDADIVMFIHRHEKKDEPMDMSKATLIVAKNRSGPIGEVELSFEGRLTKFRDMV